MNKGKGQRMQNNNMKSNYKKRKTIWYENTEMNTGKGQLIQKEIISQNITVIAFHSFKRKKGGVDKTVKDSSNLPLLKKFPIPGMAVSSPVVAACTVDIGEKFIAISAKILW